TEITIVDFSCDLVADFEFLQYVLFVWRVIHRHRVHPAFHLLPIHRKSLVSHVDLFNLTFKNVLFLAGRRCLALSGVSYRYEQAKHDSTKYRDSLHLHLHPSNFTKMSRRSQGVTSHVSLPAPSRATVSQEIRE